MTTIPHFRALLRHAAESVPLAADLYRGFRTRARAHLRRPTATPFGFTMVGDSTMASGAFEPEETRFLLESLKAADVFVDIGANVGFYTCLAASRGLHVLAFEPLQENLEYLTRNVMMNDPSKVEVFPVGLSDAPGIAWMYGGSTGASLLPGWGNATEGYRQLAPLHTYDLLVGSRFQGKRVVVKIDVEGAELHAIRGATHLLRSTPHPIWLVEISLNENRSTINPAFVETFELFWRAGYTSLTIEEPQRRIQPSDVARWFRNGERDFGSYNVAFRHSEHRD